MIVPMSNKKRDRYDNSNNDDYDSDIVSKSMFDFNDNDSVIVSKRSLYERSLNNEYGKYINQDYYNNDENNSKARHIYDSGNNSSKYYNEHDAIDYDNSGDGYGCNNYNNNNNIEENSYNNIEEMKYNDSTYNNDNNNDYVDDGIRSILGIKYKKKVDLLVDEIIIKCTRLNVRHNSISGHVSEIADVSEFVTVGPHPLSSNLSVVVPLEAMLPPSGLKLLNNQYDSDSTMMTNNNLEDRRTFPTHSGQITHSDWFIEERDDENMDEDNEENKYDN